MRKMKKFLAVLMFVLILSTIVQGVLICFAESEEEVFSVGDIVQFGSYPQTQITDEELLQKLNNRELTFTSYQYFSGDGNEGSMKPGNYMEYSDLFFEGQKYRAVRFSKYRPIRTYESNEAEDFFNEYQKNNGYEPNVVYWFKYEPLRWRVLDPDNGILLSEYILDAQAFSNFVYLRNTWDQRHNCTLVPPDSLVLHYCNEWEYCSLRKWLNKDFLNTAFSKEEKTALIENDEKDEVTLAVYEDTWNKSYGMLENKDRQALTTDYAHIMGVESVGEKPANWLLKDQGDLSQRVGCVRYTGYSEFNSFFSSLYETYITCGVRPKIQTKAFSAYHNFIGEITEEPACLDVGTMTYTCTICGKTYTEEISALGHSEPDENGDCPRCGLHIFKEEPATEPTNSSEPTSQENLSNPAVQPEEDSGNCPYCGKMHKGIFGWLILIIHIILAFFTK